MLKKLSNSTESDLSILYAHAKLAQAVIREALLKQENRERRKTNILFAFESPLVEHYCDVWELDRGTVVSAILRRNKIDTI